MDNEHPELGHNNLLVDDTGNFNVTIEHMNQFIMLCKMIPDFMKKEVLPHRIIRENKIKKPLK